jgi:glutathione S-transferase
MLTLYDYLDSGNGYKVRLLLHQLGTPFTLVEKDIFAGETRTPDYLALNPNGRIPLLQLDDGTCLAESNAILWYLADGTDFAPRERLARAQALQWQFFEQYNHEPALAVARAIVRHFPDDAGKQAMLPGLREKGHAALGVMERHLAGHDWFAGDAYSVADISLYAYTHAAEDGGVALADYPNVRAWLARVASQPGHVPITWRP